MATRGQQNPDCPAKLSLFFFFFDNFPPKTKGISAQCLQRWLCSTVKLSSVHFHCWSSCVFLREREGSVFSGGGGIRVWTECLILSQTQTDTLHFKYVNLSLYMAFLFAPCRLSLPFYSPLKKKKRRNTWQNHTVLRKSRLSIKYTCTFWEIVIVHKLNKQNAGQGNPMYFKLHYFTSS